MIYKLLGPVRSWASGSIRHKLILVLTASLTVASLCLMLLLVTFYRSRLLDERSMASVEINRLLQVALENAMLKRDIEGLDGIVLKLGQQEKISSVKILAPDGEVRFASEASVIGRKFDLQAGELCPGCTKEKMSRSTFSSFVTNPSGTEVLRSINTVPNRSECTQCHGPVNSNPVNGVLVVDYDAGQIRHETMFAALTLGAAGLGALLAAVAGIGWMINRIVLAPVARLSAAATAISQGGFGERVEPVGRDEIASLGVSFNTMARNVEKSIREIQSREQYLQVIIDAMPDGVRVIDADYKVVNANAAFLDQSGRAMAEIVGQPCYASSHSRTEPCPATLVTCPLVELSGRSKPTVFRHRHIDAHGKEIPVEVSAATLALDSGDGCAKRLIVEVIRDLSTDLKLSQEQRLSELGLLAAGVAHEIHNPLASIQFGLASLKRSLSSVVDDGSSERIRLIEGEISRCIDVTSRLLKLSQGPGERRELVVLNDIVRDVLSLLNAEALNRGCEFEIDMAPELRVVASDSEMRMLVLNLAQNALHAMPQGGTLTVSGRRGEDDIVLTFADTGVGIAAENLVRIFDPFWSRRADGVQGTGLGLSICREIVKGSAGQIRVESKKGEGARFFVRLPSADAGGAG